MGMKNSLTWPAALGKFHSAPSFPQPSLHIQLLPLPSSTTAVSLLLLCPDTLSSPALLSLLSQPPSPQHQQAARD